MSNLMLHAEVELKRAGYSLESEDEMDRVIYRNTMGIVRLFSMCGHSGGSAPIHTDMIAKLLSFEPLGPITSDVHEWQKIADGMGFEDPTWQNRRDGRMFSHDGGKTYYNVEELRYGWRRRVFGRRKMYTSAPAEGW